MIVATFPTEASAADYREALRADLQVEGRAVATATMAAHGEPYDGHQLVAAWVRRELEPEACALAEMLGGLLHDESRTTIVPGWVQDIIAAREPRRGPAVDGMPSRPAPPG